MNLFGGCPPEDQLCWQSEHVCDLKQTPSQLIKLLVPLTRKNN